MDTKKEYGPLTLVKMTYKDILKEEKKGTEKQRIVDGALGQCLLVLYLRLVES
ncbi:MAG: hypothetical protein ACLS8D_13120 [Clostridioides difficile]